MQFRGATTGFLKVLDGLINDYEKFRGNIQYLRVGNMVENDRVWLILIDHANWRRLKIWAWARIVHHNDDPALLARLEDPAYRAKVERAVLLRIEAFDWYCPQCVTLRFTEAEFAKFVNAQA